MGKAISVNHSLNNVFHLQLGVMVDARALAHVHLAATTKEIHVILILHVKMDKHGIVIYCNAFAQKVVVGMDRDV